MPLKKGKNNRPGLELQDRDIEIFLGLFESRLMTLEHLTRLYFNNRSEAAKFSLSLQEKNLAPIADWLFMGTYNPDQVKHELYATKVMGYEEETRTVTTRGESRGETRSDSHGRGSQTGSARVDGSSGSFEDNWGAPLLASHWSTSEAHSSSDSRSSSYSTGASDAYSESESEVPAFIPVFGQELSSVQFRNLEEQRFRAQQRIMFQPDRHAFVRIRGMNEPRGIVTPEVKSVNTEAVAEYRREQLAKWPFSLSYEEANRRLMERKRALGLGAPVPHTEPIRQKRVVRKGALVREPRDASKEEEKQPPRS